MNPAVKTAGFFLSVLDAAVTEKVPVSGVFDQQMGDAELSHNRSHEEKGAGGDTHMPKPVRVEDKPFAFHFGFPIIGDVKVTVTAVTQGPPVHLADFGVGEVIDA